MSVSSSTSSVEIKWHVPYTGDYDDFEVTWFPQDTLQVSGNHSTQRILEGLHPGRLYNISLRTVSGMTDSPVTYSSPVYHTVRSRECLSSLISYSIKKKKKIKVKHVINLMKENCGFCFAYGSLISEFFGISCDFDDRFSESIPWVNSFNLLSWFLRKKKVIIGHTHDT